MIELREAQEEICEFIEALKDTSIILHPNIRFLWQEKNLNCTIFGGKDYVFVAYALEDLVPGNYFNWTEKKHVRINYEFDDMWVNVTIFLPYEESKFVLLAKFIEENDLRLVLPPSRKLIEEADEKGLIDTAFGKLHQPELIHYFMVDGLTLVDLDLFKRFIMEVDNQIHIYYPGDEQ